MSNNAYLNLLYLPFTFLSISYAICGMILSWKLYLIPDVLLVITYFIGHGVSAHYVNEAYSGRTLSTDKLRFAKNVGYGSLLVVIGLGVLLLYLVKWSVYLLLIGLLELAFIILYNHPKTKVMHSDFSVGVAVGALPALAGYFVSGEAPSFGVILLALLCFLVVLLEIIPSRYIKGWKRKPTPLKVIFSDGSEEKIDLQALVKKPEDVIKVMLGITYLLPVFLFVIFYLKS